MSTPGWAASHATGRRVNEVLQVRYECISRLNGLALFWHDQTKVGNYDQAIRIPDRLSARIEQRQAKTRTRFAGRYGRPPTAQERRRLVLFPSRMRNPGRHTGVSYEWFADSFREWMETLQVGP